MPYETSSVDIDISPGLVSPGLFAIGIPAKGGRLSTGVTLTNLRIRIPEPFDIDSGTLGNSDMPYVLLISMRFRIIGQIRMDYVKFNGIDRIVKVVLGIVVFQRMIEFNGCGSVCEPV